MIKNGVASFDPPPGLLKRGFIVSYDPSSGMMDVQLAESQAQKGSRPLPVQVPAPFPLFYNNGLFMGSMPAKYTPVIVGISSGGQYYFVSFLAENLSVVPQLNLGELLIQSNDDTSIKLDLQNNISIGSATSKLHINTNNPKSPKTNFITLNFENENHLTQAYRSIGGLIKRDLKPNNQFDPETKLEDDNYDPIYKLIGLDPSATANDLITGSSKNPPFVEHREMVYEFQYQSNVDDDLSEASKYNSSPNSNVYYTSPNRRKSRADTLSLSLVAPNYLMESVKGTVVDIFGNLLDMNRAPLAIGKDPSSTIRSNVSTNQEKSFINIRGIERKGLAYHFEINARKDPNPTFTNTNPPLDINADNYNAKLQRSRFFMDIDKEGQIKVNVPASSETGNIPLLARYENYSTFGPEDNGNPNKLWFRDDNLDIFLDSIASPMLTPNASGGFDATPDRGSINIMAGDAPATPIDRLTGSHIRHGQPFHDILQTCLVHQNSDFISYQSGIDANPLDLSYIPELKNIVSTTIQTTGPNANSGGRSGSINLDGSLEMSIGANTVDRQSLWLDAAGGLVANIGRDKNQRSAMINMDGDFYFQIGGFGVSGDARFASLGQDGAYGAVLDLRIFTGGGYSNMIRIDSHGITVLSPGNISIESKGDMKLVAGGNLDIQAETLTLQERMVLKVFGGSI
jgi:hypothetical protein